MLLRRTFYVAFLMLFSFGVPVFNGSVRADEDARANEKADAPKHPSAGDLERDDEYYELLQLFADTLDQVDRNYVKDVSRRELMEAAIKGMISKLDQYSNYIPPEEIDRFKGSVESEFGGIGIQVSIEGGYPTVISPIYGSPAYEAGMIAGDKIVKIGDKSAEGITLDEAVKLMKGKVGTKVQVTVRHAADRKEEEFELKSSDRPSANRARRHTQGRRQLELHPRQGEKNRLYPPVRV